MTKRNALSEMTRETLLETYKTKSAAIRAMDQEGMTRSEIAKRLDIRYQHVRNVLITPIKREPLSL